MIFGKKKKATLERMQANILLLDRMAEICGLSGLWLGRVNCIQEADNTAELYLEITEENANRWKRNHREGGNDGVQGL